MSGAPKHFRSGSEFRAWLETHHDQATERVLLFYNKDSGRGGITYPEALDEALCFGWIDGVLRKVDAISHSRRFSPRRPGSTWSRVNVGHAERLIKAGRMHPAGLAVYRARTEAKTGLYSFEQRPDRFPPELERAFRRDGAAWKFWQAQPPGYRRVTLWWVISAKQDATRQRRLARLMTEAAASRRLGLV